MGIFPLIGAVVLIGGCLAWYYCYARSRVARKGAFFRTAADEAEIEIFEQARSRNRRPGETVIVPFFGLKDKDMLQVERRIRLAAALCDERKVLDVVDLVEVPEQSFLSAFDPEPESFEALQKRVEMLRNEIENKIHLDQVVTHSSRGALRNYAEQEHPYWVVFDWQEPSTWSVLIGTWTWWLEDFPCDSLFFKDRGKAELKDIVVLAEPGPFDGEVVYAADHIARFFDGHVSFMNPLTEYSQRALDFVDSYQDELQELCRAPSSARSVTPEEWVNAVLERTSEADLLLVGGLTDEAYENFNAKSRANEIINRTECSVARVRSNIRTPQSVLHEYDQLGSSFGEHVPENNTPASRLSVDDKEELFRAVAEDLAPKTVGADTVEDSMWEREEKQSTYCEGGIALPHSFVDSMDMTITKIYVLDESIKYDQEGSGVDIVAVTIGPSSTRGEHLTIIGQLSKELAHSAFRKKLRESEDPNQIIREKFSVEAD
jgi:mannitol/fructose-specific phosphotransferase system IIA component (Ntr-type)/nucleotide-binding universal stress UspA family protein